MGRSTKEETRLSEHRRYRKFTARQKLEIVLASLRGDRSVAELCREHGIAESLLRKWREQALEAAAERFESGQERSWYRAGPRIPQTWVVGDADRCVRELSAFIAEHGITDLVTWAVPPGLRPEQMNHSLERFAREVAPRLRQMA